MSSQNNEVTRNEPLEWFVISFVALAIFLFLATKYHMDIWYHSKKSVYSVLVYVPEPVFFYASGAGELIPLAYKDLLHHRKDFRSYYKTDPVGVRKKTNIDKASWRIFAPIAFIIMVLVVFRERRKKMGSIDKPGGRHAMYGYIRTMQEIFPYIKPAIPYMEKVSSLENIDEGWFAGAKMPLSWVNEKKLTNTFSIEKQRSLIVKRQRLTFVLDEDATYVALREQLGRPWAGIKELTFIEQCALVVICPQIYGRVKESRLNNRFFLNNLDTLRAILNVKNHKGVVPKSSDSQKKLVIDFVASAIKKYEYAFEESWFDLTEFDEPFDPILASFQSLNSEQHMKDKADDIVRQVLLGFRYVNTVFLALYDRSWMYGVLSSSEVLWIKEFNRPLYYIFAQQGRLSCFVETAGSWAHYLSEKAHGFRMLSPQLYEGMLAIDRDLFETHDNYNSIVDWSDAARWNKMVPDLSDSVDGSAGATKGARSGVSSLL